MPSTARTKRLAPVALVALAASALGIATATGHARATIHPSLAPRPRAATTGLVLDQDQSSYTGGLSVRVAAAQTFTMGLDGSLARVDLPLCSPSKNSDVRVTVSAGGRSVSASTIFPRSYADCVWYSFTFAQPIVASTGEVVSLTVTTQNHKAALWGYDGHDGDPYPRGSGNWHGLTINDFAFRTYVQ